VKALYAPWRAEYVRGKKPMGCIFCKDSLRNEEFVLYEGQRAFVMMNRYPYSCGHLMIIPVRHVAELNFLTLEEKQELFELIDMSLLVLREAMSPDGFNIGMNIGRVAGAGVDDHLHFHVVPRWNGDINFMTVLSETRVISEDLKETRDKITLLFKKLSRTED